VNVAARLYLEREISHLQEIRAGLQLHLVKGKVVRGVVPGRQLRMALARVDEACRLLEKVLKSVTA